MYSMSRATVRIRVQDLIPGDSEAYGLGRTVERVWAWDAGTFCVTWADGHGTSYYAIDTKIVCS
jgi:hypothetical protein